LLGFKLIEDFRYENKPVYARLRAPGGDGTIALHLAGPEVSVLSDGVRLYFEVGKLDDFCRNLQQKGFHITQLPRMMPWGWRPCLSQRSRWPRDQFVLGRRKPYEENGDEGRAKGRPVLTPASRNPTGTFL